MSKARLGLLFLAIAFALLPSVVSAQIAVGTTDEDRAEFARHRAALFERLGDEVAVFIGAYRRGDNLRFRQNNRFYYLTGVEIPFSALVMDGRSDKAVLFIPPARTGRMAVYEGKTVGPGAEAVAMYGIDDVRPIKELEEFLKGLYPEGGVVRTVFAPEENIAGSMDAGIEAQRRAKAYPWSSYPTREESIRTWLQSLLPNCEIKDISVAIDDLRRVKSPWEIERMTVACRSAGEGHTAAMKATKPGVKEYHIEAAAMGGFIKNGALYQGYNAIVGAGSNNNILHYSLSAGEVKDGDLILMDFGPDYRYYCSDITRTWPANGKFSNEQRKAYVDCLEIQRKVIEFIKPGVTLQQIFQHHRKVAVEMGYEKNFVHGPSHYLGMAVHDVGAYLKPLEPGVVITVEPGLYFPDKGWGIRIEDDVLVTKGGCRVLSDMIPKDPDEIEAIMAGKTTGNNN